jgi:hypothetical protein
MSEIGKVSQRVDQAFTLHEPASGPGIIRYSLFLGVR